MPKVGEYQIKEEGGQLILQRYESYPWDSERWKEVASGETLEEIHEHLREEFASYYGAYDPHIAVDSSEAGYILGALRYIEQKMWGD